MFNKRGAEAINWKGGRWESSRGYVHVRVGSRYKLEHVLIVEKALGRKLVKLEVVHHINGNKKDNRSENLWVCKQGAHRKAHHSAFNVVTQLLTQGLVQFNRETGAYEL